MVGVNALEGRTLKERLARHVVLRELLKEPEIYDSDSEEEEFQNNVRRAKLSKVE